MMHLIFEDDFNDTEESRKERTQLINNATLGASFSAAAGMVAWLIRGGALAASVMASTPVWVSLDPVRVISDKPKNDQDNEEDSVEQYFDN